LNSKEFAEKFTFGFIMAQLFPGLVAIVSITLVLSSIGGKEVSLLAAISCAVSIWTKTITSGLTLLFLSVCAGMAIHGLHWAVMGFMERYDPVQKKCSVNNDPKPVAESFWHDLRMALQIILGPIKLCREICLFLFTKSSVSAVAIEENVVFISNDRMEQFHNIQDFYLHFAQFYAHTSYALLLFFLGLIVFTVGSGATGKRLLLMALVYVITGFFFLVSRIQFRAQFAAEFNLRQDAKSPRK
jgi:hypothetical protein